MFYTKYKGSPAKKTFKTHPGLSIPCSTKVSWELYHSSDLAHDCKQFTHEIWDLADITNNCRGSWQNSWFPGGVSSFWEINLPLSKTMKGDVPTGQRHLHKSAEFSYVLEDTAHMNGFPSVHRDAWFNYIIHVHRGEIGVIGKYEEGQLTLDQL